MKKMFMSVLAGVALALATAVNPLAAEDSIIVQSTTSTQNSGLYDHILPMFEEETGIKVNVVAVGTGQALENGRRGDGDVLLVHAKPAEEKFVAEGYGVERYDVMYNDFVIVGPADDPAGVKGMDDAPAALAKIAEEQAAFASRGDDSGTHKKEMSLWDVAGVDPTRASGTWYRETGSGMGATLNTGVGMDAYVMTDRATWISFGNKGDHEILVEGDPSLFNQYGIIMVNPEKHPNVNVEAAQSFIDWILSEEGQSAIASFEVQGQQLFTPNADRGEG
ncbi:substrate-binding domain-containing protein [Dichotomicrobium thermohalophilum]|uniref:Tungstate transport system substrate-binding protein n=1 Tax=Dichotomicrobium thermohalophilum TaxID=933063 RepID=A0A397PC94_9HYPH|nr:substrate-binding domain-containing protein [Dichotomicrobium thermohalophilum]RIA47200.1 tungstate transport system substrate-binding protein [Dichotomicrobium thermohalophilum]